MLDFYIKRTNFSNVQEGASGVVTQTVSHTFSTDIRKGEAALKAFSLNYKTQDHNFHTGRAEVSEAQITGNTIECDVTLQLVDKSDNTLDPGQVFAGVLFIVDCD
uniref:Uncharacterized protein n=1 Tax=Pseudobryopsis hainanensis TaxID=2320808 RepID=A0A3S5X2H6_9CHLO|nr:hypothetical protein [Pseudobryopsis hainanensis]